ncbi:ATP-binding protein, partial [Aquabacterium sp.]|uniref:ATP-binding protein n=1 Tax=Aquabacterium sp. TaxID=1872578 RepID=UPI0037851C0E
MKAPAAPRLRVRLLGELELRSADGALRPLPPSRRTRALLGYLVATGTPQARTALCDLLWDGPDDPRAALRWSLTKLRAVVDDEAQPRLQADRERVAFEARGCDIDCTQVRVLLERGPLNEQPIAALESAAQALQGEFLDGLELPACYRFHHWVMAERERFGRLRRAVLETLVSRLTGEPQRALPHGRAMVAADPLAEGAHATLVRLLAAAGRYPEAERHYAWARELLRRELALPDGGLLDDSIRSVRRQQRLAMTTPASEAPREPSPETPPAGARTGFAAWAAGPSSAAAALFGRDEECRAIDAAIAAPATAPVLLFTGEPGIGKTRLLDHLAERAAATGLRLIRARCFEAEMLRPYGVWLDALRALATGDADVALLARIRPLLGGNAGPGNTGPGEGGHSREQLFEATAALLAALAQQQPIALLVDDLQWIDDASAALLHYVARRLADPPLPLLLAAAARAGEVDDNAGAKRLLSLGRARVLQHQRLGPLDAQAVRRWLGDQLADADQALRDSGGNPLYLSELARAQGRGAAQAEPSLQALIDERLRMLDEPAQDLLGWAAALGSEFRAEWLAEATALPVAEVLGRIAQFERRGLLRATEAGGFDFVHGLVRQQVYRAPATPRRRALHRQIARMFTSASRDDPWLHGAVVHHASLAGDALPAARAALAAGEHWLRAFANVEAAQVAERGLALLDELPANAEKARLEIGLLRLRVAAAATGARRLPPLAPRIEQAIAAAEALALHTEAGAGWEILAFWRQQAGDAAGAQAATLAAERCTRRADDITRCQQLANTARCLIDIEADDQRGRALLADAAALAATLQLPVMELEWGRGLVARADGDAPAACAALARAVALARAAANHWRECECMLALATVEYELGRHDELLVHLGEVARAAQRMGESQVPFADALAALVRLQRAEPGAAAALQAALDALRERDDKARLAYALNAAATRALAAGNKPEAARQAAEALAAATAVRRASQITRAQATLAAAAAPGPRPFHHADR